MLRPYRLLGDIPHAIELVSFALIARLHVPALPIVLTFLVVDWSGSYATAGAVAGALTVGQAVAGPLRGRAADRRSGPKLLVVTGIGFAFGLGAITLLTMPGGFLPASWWWLALPVASLTGLSFPPVGQITRASWSRIAEGPAREAAYAIEATMQELVFVAGPMLFAFVVAFFGPVWASALCGLWSVIGPSLLGIALWRAGLSRPPGSGHGRGRIPGDSLFTVPGFVPVLGFGTTLIAGVIATDLLIVGWARELAAPQLAGVLAAVWASGSLLGGLLAGARVGPPRLWPRAAMVVLGFVVLVPSLPPIADPASPWLVGMLLLIGGMAIAPTLAAANSRLAELAPGRRRAEAFGWWTSATTAGGALASPLAGWLLDIAGPAAVAAASAGLTMVAVFFAAHHSLRGSLSAPLGEETVAT
ncbi:MFS transporter [Parasphingorhabdus pacifica]